MEEIYHEGRFFLASLFCGILILFFYDFFRVLRYVIPHSKWAVFWEDYFFWVVSGFCVFLMMYQVNKGSIRSFSILGIGLGMAGYHFGPSTPLVHMAGQGLRSFIGVIKKIVGTLMGPVRFLWRKSDEILVKQKKKRKKVKEK